MSRFGGQVPAACLVEPIAVGAGVLVPPKGYLERLRAICDAHRLLLVFDEAASGLGRSGGALASRDLGVTPDLVVLGEEIANGAQPIGAVLVRDEIGATIWGSPEAAKAARLIPAPPSSGACAAACATLNLYVRERLFDRAERLVPVFLDAMFSLSDLPVIADIRGYGLLAALDFVPTRIAGARGSEMRARLESAGLVIEIRGDTAILAPALTTDERQIERMAAILREALSRRSWSEPPRRSFGRERAVSGVARDQSGR